MATANGRLGIPIQGLAMFLLLMFYSRAARTRPSKHAEDEPAEEGGPRPGLEYEHIVDAHIGVQGATLTVLQGGGLASPHLQQHPINHSRRGNGGSTDRVDSD